MATTTYITGGQFDSMPYDEGRRWELLNGEMIPVSSPTPRHQDIVFEILLALRRYFEQSRTAGLAYQDVEFALTDNDRVRPDVAVLLGERALHLNLDKIPIPGCPDIAVAVISPTERASESHEKVQAYLRNGAAEVWQVYPKSRTIQIHRGEISRSIAGNQAVETELLPNFVLQLVTLSA